MLQWILGMFEFSQNAFEIRLAKNLTEDGPLTLVVVSTREGSRASKTWDKFVHVLIQVIAFVHLTRQVCRFMLWAAFWGNALVDLNAATQTPFIIAKI